MAIRVPAPRPGEPPETAAVAVWRAVRDSRVAVDDDSPRLSPTVRDRRDVGSARVRGDASEREQPRPRRVVPAGARLVRSFARSL